MNTTNNINVEAGSHVGQINAGALVFLDHCVTTLMGWHGGEGFAAALQEFTQQVVNSQELSQESQKEILDLLKHLMEQVEHKDRNRSLFRVALGHIGALVGAVTAISEHWDKLKVFFEATMKR